MQRSLPRRAARAGALLLALGMLAACSAVSPRSRIEEDTGLTLPQECEIDFEDTHGGFHGDGVASAAVTLSEEDAARLRGDIEASGAWSSLPLPEEIGLLLYPGERDGQAVDYGFAEKAGIPVVTAGYWMFRDRFESRDPELRNTSILDRPAFNFTAAIFDADAGVLYYCKVDT